MNDRPIRVDHEPGSYEGEYSGVVEGAVGVEEGRGLFELPLREEVRGSVVSAAGESGTL